MNRSRFARLVSTPPILLLAVALAGAGCGPTETDESTGLRLEIAACCEPAESSQESAVVTRGTASIGDVDIVEFIWETQTLVLSAEAAERVSALEEEGSLRPGSFVLYFNETELASGLLVHYITATRFDAHMAYFDPQRGIALRANGASQSQELAGFGLAEEVVEAIYDHFRSSGRLG